MLLPDTVYLSAAHHPDNLRAATHPSIGLEPLLVMLAPGFEIGDQTGEFASSQLGAPVNDLSSISTCALRRTRSRGTD